MSAKISKRTAKGFTLIELVIVIAVIAILAAVLAPTILGQADRAKSSRAKSDVAEIAKAMSRMRNDVGKANFNATCAVAASLDKATSAASASTTAAGCGALTTKCADQKAHELGQPCWGGPYLSATPLNDPWTKPYIIDAAGLPAVTVKSYGENGVTNNCDPASDDICVTQ